MLNVKKLALLAIALIVVGAAGVFYTRDTAKNVVDETKDLQQQSFKAITVNVDNARMDIVSTKDETPKVKLEGKQSSHNKHRFSVKIQHDVLRINLEEKQKKLFYIDFFQKPLHLYVYVPEKQYKKLHVQGNNGQIRINNMLANEVRASTDNGRLYLSDLKGDRISAETNNGRIDAKEILADELQMRSDNGHIELKQASTSLANIETSNGKISLEDVDGEIIGKTDNGRISIVTPQINHPMDLTSHNGSINIETKHKPQNALFNIEVHNGRASIYGKDKTNAIFGEGKNMIKLTSHNGKITVK